MAEDVEKCQQSQRAKDHEAMLEEALARPGVREVMSVFEHWRKTDQGLDAYRLATRENGRVTYSNSTNDQEFDR